MLRALVNCSHTRSVADRTSDSADVIFVNEERKLYIYYTGRIHDDLPGLGSGSEAIADSDVFVFSLDSVALLVLQQLICCFFRGICCLPGGALPPWSWTPCPTGQVEADCCSAQRKPLLLKSECMQNNDEDTRPLKEKTVKTRSRNKRTYPHGSVAETDAFFLDHMVLGTFRLVSNLR
jgi:hypothetical protein